MFSGKTQVPCVGISFGIDRIFSILSASQRKDRRNEVDVYVMAFGGKDFDGLLKERAQICTRLWDAGIKVGCIGRTLGAESWLTHTHTIGRISLQSEAQTPKPVQGRRGGRCAIRPHSGRGK